MSIVVGKYLRMSLTTELASTRTRACVRKF